MIHKMKRTSRACALDVVLFRDGKVFILSEGEGTRNATVRLGIKEGALYKLLGHPVVNSKGS